MAARRTETPEEMIRQADASYRGFPGFADWAARRVDFSPWESSRGSFEREKQRASHGSLRRALDFALRAAAVDTGAIEGLYAVDRGFTFSIAAQTAAWESMLAAKGPHVRRLFESQLEGLELVVDAVTSKTEISEAWIRRLHEVLCAAQDTYEVLTSAGWQQQALPKGSYKEHANHVGLRDGGVHLYCPVDRTGDEMHRLVGELRRPDFAEAHPVLQASYAHFALVVVHPFADGNGRVARALACVFTYRACSIPLVVYVDQKVRYLDALAGSDSGSFERFVSFILSANVDTMNELVERLRDANAGSVREAARHLDGLYASAGPPTPQELDAIAARVASVVREVFAREVAETPLPGAITHAVSLDHAVPANERTFRSVHDGSASVLVSVGSAMPAAGVAYKYQVVVAAKPEGFYALQVEQMGNAGIEPLRLRLDLVHPSLTASFHGQLEPWIRLRIRELLAELTRRVEKERLRSARG